MFVLVSLSMPQCFKHSEEQVKKVNFENVNVMPAEKATII